MVLKKKNGSKFLLLCVFISLLFCHVYGMEIHDEYDNEDDYDEYNNEDDYDEHNNEDDYDEYIKKIYLEPEGPSKIHCVFIHGLNPYSFPKENEENVKFYTSETINDELTEELKGYWGNEVSKWTQENQVQPCTTYAFTYTDTMAHGYQHEHNHTAANNAVNFHGVEPKKRRIFLHSMGNLIFYNALANGHLEIRENKDTVYNLAGPFDGAPIIKTLNQLCSVLDNLLTEQQLKRFCTDGKASPGPQSCAEVRDENLLGAAYKYGTGGFCGTTNTGPFNLYKILGKITNKNDDLSAPADLDNDGVVPVNSCMAFNEKEFLNNMNTNFFVGPYHHGEIGGGTDNEEVLEWLRNCD